MLDDSNLILAHLDNDAIFLLSEKPVLSPKGFVNAMANLQETAYEMGSLIARKNYMSYSDFGLASLNINFANLELATGMNAEVMEHYLFDEGKKAEKSCYIGKDLKIGTAYSTENGTISHSLTSQYGVNLLGFLDEMIRENPDVRLLMSNVVCKRRPLDLMRAMEDAIGTKYNSRDFKRGQELTSRDYESLKAHPVFRNDKELAEDFKKEKDFQLYRRNKNNEEYEVYPAFKYVVELLGNTPDVDEKYLLEWYDGDPDKGRRAIEYALNNISVAARREDDTNMLAPRTVPEVKEYMGALDSRAGDINRSIMQKQQEKSKKIK